MNKVCVALLCAFTVSCAPVLAGPHEEVTNYLVRGNRYMEDNDFNQALFEFNRAVDYVTLAKVEAEFPITYFNRGRCFEQMRRYQEAVVDYSRALELDCGYILALYNRGVVYQKLERLDDALQDYSRIIEIVPSAVHAFNNRGLVYTSKGQISKAVADFTRATEIDPRAVHVRLNRGLAYLAMGDYGSAGADFAAEHEMTSSLDADWLCSAVDCFQKRKFGECRMIVEQLKRKNYIFPAGFIEELDRECAGGKK
jgi:tetratricopeptide (TPR) repeat protein